MTKQITLRLSGETHDRLKTEAEHDRRSLHAQVLTYIDRGLAAAQEGESNVTSGHTDEPAKETAK